jgi:hypothetical protein
MISLPGQHLKGLPITGLLKVRDLEYFEGPLLSHFRHERGDHYLYCWCDCDEKANRWMVLRVSETSIIRLVNRFVPLDQVVPKACQDDFVYFVELDSAGSVAETVLCLNEQIPEVYLPEPGVYLDSEIAKDDRSYAVLIEGTLTTEQLSEIPTGYAQAYAFLHTVLVLKPESFVGYPWRGGFSAMHFFRMLLNRLPWEHRPSVMSLQYASPGFIRFTVSRPTANMVAACVEQFTDAQSSAKDACSRLRSYIYENKLNDLRDAIPDSHTTEWEPYNPELMSRTRALLDAIHIDQPDAFYKAVPSPFETAKIVLAFTNRLRELSTLVKDGLIRFPVS